MNLWRIGFGIALNGSPESRWRQISVVLATLVFTVMLLGAASVFGMQHKEERRGADQVAVLSTHPAPSDVLLLRSDDEWQGSPIQVVTVQVGTGSAWPPGLQTWPHPGETAVSPALSQLMSANPALARRYPHRDVMTAEGIRSGGELLAYRVVRPGVLDDDATVLHVKDGNWVGSGPVVRVASFGESDPGLSRIRLTSPVAGSRGEMTAGLLTGLVLPGLVALAVGLSAGSSMRTRRFDVLQALGVSRSTQRRVGTVETMILAVPGALAGTAGWAIASRWLESVPAVGHRVVRGDLALPWWALIGCLTIVLVVVAVVAAASTALRSLRTLSPRPAGGRPLLSRLAMVPACGAIAAFAAGKIVGGDREADLVLIGTAIAVIATPLMMPTLLRSAGGALAASRSPIRSLVGHGMLWDPARVGRPFVGLGAALVLMLAATGYLGLAQFTETPPGLKRGQQAVAVEWRGAASDALSTQAGRVDALVVPYASPEDKVGPESEAALATTCPQVAVLVGGPCDPSAPYQLSPQTEQKLVRMLGSLEVSGAPLTAVKLVSVAEAIRHADQTRGQALVLADRPLTVLDQQVRNVAMSSFPWARVTSLLQSVQSPSPLVPWIKGGLVVALSTLALACLLSLIDRLQAAQQRHQQLVSLGLSPRDLMRLSRWLFSAPYSVVCAASAAAGVVICSLIVRPILPLPWKAVGAVLIFVLVCGALGAMVTGLAGTRTAPETATRRIE